MFIGTGEALVTMDVSFDPELLSGDMEEDVRRIERTLVDNVSTRESMSQNNLK